MSLSLIILLLQLGVSVDLSLETDGVCQLGDLESRGLTISGLPPAKYGHTLRFQCDDRYFLNGEKEVTCLETGEWSAPFPICSAPKACEKAPALENGHFRSFLNYFNRRYNHSEEVLYACQENYIMNGTGHKTCRNGEWIGHVACLAPKMCERAPAIENGDIIENVKDQYNHNEIVTYACQRYYTFKGWRHKTCKNGEWIGHTECLGPCTVTEEDIRPRNIAFKYTIDTKVYLADNDLVEFRCTRGRRVGNVQMRQRCSAGVIQLPTCQ